MGQARVPYGVVLGVERILLEFSDCDHPLSITEIQTYLKEIYGFEVSNDTLTKRIIPEMKDFSWGALRSEKDVHALCPGWELYPPPKNGVRSIGGEDKTRSNAEKHQRKKIRVWMDNRLFSDYEVNYLADTVASAVFLGEGKSKDLVNRIQSLQSRNSRSDRVLRRSSGPESAKPDFRDIALAMEDINDAIAKRWTISFDYYRYGTERIPGTVEGKRTTLAEQGRQSGEHFENLSPYRLQYMDEHYFLLANAKGKTATRDRFRVFRLDLIREISFSSDSELYKPLVNEDAPADYFRGAVSGIGGRRKTVKLRCSESAYHYVAERFSEFEGYAVSRPKDDPDGWLLVQFKAVPKGVGFWVQKFLTDIELLAPKETRDMIVSNLSCNAYKQCKRI